MFSMFAAGGFVMVPVLLLGSVAVGAGACHALAPATAWRQSAASLRTALLLLSAAGVCMNVAAVVSHLDGAATLEVLAQQAAVGLGEALSPAVLGTLLATLGALLGAARDARQP